MTSHVVSLNLAKQLKAAGYPQESEFWWLFDRDSSPQWELIYDDGLFDDYKDSDGFIAAPLATEIMERLPKIKVSRWELVEEWVVSFDGDVWIERNKSLPDALAQCWLWLKENGNV